MAKKVIKYSEPGNYFPKEIRDKVFGKQEKDNKTTTKKTTSKKK